MQLHLYHFVTLQVLCKKSRFKYTKSFCKELLPSKGVVLMRGEVNTIFCDRQEAVELVNWVCLYR